ncbi:MULTISPECIES: 5'-methylthioadenosine nucleosidase [unclassified Halobacteriovorax]|uniref:phosphorylase family protein n=1 Tax=unclassified Halobacteriovorax TaxID=2639665 RepID=UPI000EA10A9A|nr:5'-methylthioadenosine nucleosidase [Halobacteriovorax sp. BALOs_7]AYF45113.1 phosphorylase family protein [Halobacteriovorax sp. BALOs_7]
MKNIAVIMAMDSEAKPLLEKLKINPDQAEKIDDHLPMKVYKTQYHQHNISIIISGECKRNKVQNVGTAPAVISTITAIKDFNADFIINAGTAGGFKKRGADIGKVYTVETTVFHDRRIPIPGYQDYGTYKSQHDIAKKFATLLGIETGIISTGDSLDMSPEDEKLIESNLALLKDMEAAAIAWVTDQYSIPTLFLKSVTDIVDGEHPTEEEFFANLKLASENLGEKLIELIEKI